MLGNIKVDSKSKEKRNLDKMLQSHGIHVLNLPPTRQTNHSQISIIQCTNTNEDELSYAVIQTGLSDYTVQSYTVAIDKPNYKLTRQSNTRIFSEKTMDELKRYLQAQDWTQVTRYNDVESAYSSFSILIQCATNIACPLKTIKLKKKKKINMWSVENQTLKTPTRGTK